MPKKLPTPIPETKPVQAQPIITDPRACAVRFSKVCAGGALEFRLVWARSDLTDLPTPKKGDACGPCSRALDDDGLLVRAVRIAPAPKVSP